MLVSFGSCAACGRGRRERQAERRMRRFNAWGGVSGRWKRGWLSSPTTGPMVAPVTRCPRVPCAQVCALKSFADKRSSTGGRRRGKSGLIFDTKSETQREAGRLGHGLKGFGRLRLSNGLLIKHCFLNILTRPDDYRSSRGQMTRD